MTRIRNISMFLIMLSLSLTLINTASADPIAITNGPYETYWGGDVLLCGEGSTTDNSSTITSYEWKALNTNYVLSTYGAPLILWSTIYAAVDLQSAIPYVMPLGFTVTDNLNNSRMGYTTMTIYDRHPFAIANWYGDLYSGQPLVLDGSDSFHGMPSHTILLYEWKVVGSNTSWSSQEPIFQLDYNTYSQFLSRDPITGLYIQNTLTLTVTDDLGLKATDSFVIDPPVPTSNTAPVPEPATLILLGSGLVGLAGFRKKLKRS